MRNNIDLSIIIVNYNTKEITRQCLHSILINIEAVRYELIVIDNGSKDGSAGMIEESFPIAVLIKNSNNLGFSKAVNQGIRIASGKCLMFLNSDIVIKSNVFKSAIDYLFQNNNVGVVGGRLVYPDGSFQLSAWKFPNIFLEFLQRVLIFRVLMNIPWYRYYMDSHKSAIMDVDWVTGAFMAVKKEALNGSGLFDESFFMYYEDTDLCARIKKNGWRVVFLPHISALHYDAMTRKLVSDSIYIQARKSQYYYYKKHCGPIQTFLLRVTVILVSLIKIAVQCLNSFLRCNDSERNTVSSMHKSIIKEMLYPS